MPLKIDYLGDGLNVMLLNIITLMWLYVINDQMANGD